ncbi:hypothetical protein [Bdellovibrio sp.]|uniref:hypothetical protein n=1 Tax=Bdellovibrio TaxID=958 RepID=UPI003221FC9E
MKQLVEICSGCIVRSSGEEGSSVIVKREFLEKLQNRLQELRPDIEWSVSTTSCMRFCPPQRMSMVVANRMEMSRSNTVESVADDIVSRIK